MHSDADDVAARLVPRRRHTHTHVNYNIRTSAYDVIKRLHSSALTGKLTINIPVENFTGFSRGSVRGKVTREARRRRRDRACTRTIGVRELGERRFAR